jgi:hypothetical protein
MLQHIEHWWQHLWEQVMLFFKTCFKAMGNARLLDINDPYQHESFTIVFLPILQHVIDEYIGVWNTH